MGWSTRESGAETLGRRRSLDEADLGLAVRKNGRTTEYTEGFLHGLLAAIRVAYGASGSAVFVDQIIASKPQDAPRFCDGGDSGSMAYDSEERCIGLLFAGGDGALDTPVTMIINPIDHDMR